MTFLKKNFLVMSCVSFSLILIIIPSASAQEIIIADQVAEQTSNQILEQSSNQITNIITANQLLEVPLEIKEQEKSTLEDQVVSVNAKPSSEIVGLAWQASSRGNFDELRDLVQQCLDHYGSEADAQQAQLKDFPISGEAKNYQSLNDVATCLFIRAEFLMNQSKKEDAIKEFQSIVDRYAWAQAWDPRGWYWSVKEKSQASIDVLTGKAEHDLEMTVVKTNRTVPVLFTQGKEKVLDYSRFGKFLNIGTPEYHYAIKDVDGLSTAIGEGIYPNTISQFKNPAYKIAKKDGRLEKSHWDYASSDDLEAAYFKWVSAPEPFGVRLFYIGNIFEKAGMYYEAIKAYHALVVHYPKTISWTYWHTPWYPAQAAIAKIRYLIRIHPELNLEVKQMKIVIQNGFDNDINNDIISTWPGKIVQKGPFVKAKKIALSSAKISLGKVVKEIGTGTVRLVKYQNHHWQLLVDNKPYVIHGITYMPTKIGESPDKGTLKDWMKQDTNNNGQPDGPFDTWVDKNRNNIQDDDEKAVGDFQLMKEMGVNTIRFYHQPNEADKILLRRLYNDYGMRVVMGDFLGKYAIGSGATWLEGTDYENPVHKKNMMDTVRGMVLEYKDEPYVLLWLLGNENNYGIASNADKKPEAFYKFVDEVAQMIKSIDPNHPVAINNGDTLFLDQFGKFCPNVDIFTANVYRGDYGFGSFWEQVRNASDKPAFITEFGCPAFARHLSLEEGDLAQANYHLGNWLDIQDNLAGSVDGVGNSLGGIVFEWLDEWWKNYEPYLHDRKSDAIGPFPGGYYFEEWFGIADQGNGSNSPFMRHLRKAYFIYQELWNKK